MNRTRTLGTLVDVACRVVRDEPGSIAIVVEGRTVRRGETIVSEWIWLPKKHVATRPGKVRMPEWLARDRRLIQ